MESNIPETPNVKSESKWCPPSRPEWVRRTNEEGYCMDIPGVVPLDENSLLNSAMNATGLDDFGADDWLEPFRVLIDSIEKDADLNLMGRLRTRSDLLCLLKGRLKIEDAYKRYPEIDDEEIREPFIVIGQGRSGTSYLMDILGAHPDNAYMTMWEAMEPCPPPDINTYTRDPRIESAGQLIEQWNRVTPTLPSMHRFGASYTSECCAILAFNFMSPSWFDALGQVAGYDNYILQQDMAPAFQYHKRVLKLLQWKNPRKHWVLKDILHLDNLEQVLKTYPDANFVWPHRDPVKALASVTNLLGTLQWARSDYPFKGGSYEYMVDPQFSAARLDAVIEKLKSGVIPENQIHHILYRDLIADPVSCLKNLYQHFNLPLSETGLKTIKAFIKDNPRNARPPHNYDMAHVDSVMNTRALYNNYQTYFNIPDE